MIEAVKLTDNFPIGKLNMPRRSAAKFIPVTVESVVPSISFGLGRPPQPLAQETLIRDATISVVAGSYLCMGIGVALSSLLGNLFMQQTLIVLAPAWSVTVALHAVCRPWGELVTGTALIAIYPFAVLLNDAILWVLYFILFSLFSSVGFWREQRGVLLILSVVAWLGVLSSAGVTFLFHNHDVSVTSMHFAGVFALLLAITSTQELGRFQLRIYSV